MGTYMGQDPTLTKPEDSPYYWWWMYLKLHDGYIDTCNSEGDGEFSNLYTDFGDIRDDGGDAFLVWWGVKGKKHGRLFQERTLVPRAVTVTSAEQLIPPLGQYPYVAVVVDIHMGLRRTFKILTKELGVNFNKSVGRMAMRKRYSTARYKLSNYSSAKKLRSAYETYKLLNPAVRKFKGIEKIPPREIKKLWKDLRLISTQDIHETYHYAENLIDWVGRGSFPGPPPKEFKMWEEHFESIVRASKLPLTYMEY